MKEELKTVFLSGIYFFCLLQNLVQSMVSKFEQHCLKGQSGTKSRSKTDLEGKNNRFNHIF